MNVFVFVLCLFGMILWFIYAVARIGVSRREAGYSADETELIQDLNRNLQKMEQRIETLETLLTEKTEKENPPTFEEVMRKKDSAH